MKNKVVIEYNNEKHCMEVNFVSADGEIEAVRYSLSDSINCWSIQVAILNFVRDGIIPREAKNDSTIQSR